MIRGIKIGFSGSQHGMNQTQATLVYDLLNSWRYTETLSNLAVINEFHHGDCIRADNYAHQIAQHFGYETHIHPPIEERKRAFSCDGDKHYIAQDYLVRNHIIVEMTDRLITAPNTCREQLRSGTWATYRYAKKCGKKVYLLLPDGVIETFDGYLR